MDLLAKINFKRPMGLIQLDGVPLLPHALACITALEPRDRQLIDHCLRSARPSQILQAAPLAVATGAGEGLTPELPRLRGTVCVGKMVRREAGPRGCHQVLVHGVCRARIVRVIEPEGDRRYRQAIVEPLPDEHAKSSALVQAKTLLGELLRGPHLQKMKSAQRMARMIEQESLPPAVAFEIAGFVLVRDAESRYQLLEETDACRRARLVWLQLRKLDAMIAMAESQSQSQWPKGMSWN